MSKIYPPAGCSGAYCALWRLVVDLRNGVFDVLELIYKKAAAHTLTGQELGLFFEEFDDVFATFGRAFGKLDDPIGFRDDAKYNALCELALAFHNAGADAISQTNGQASLSAKEGDDFLNSINKALDAFDKGFRSGKHFSRKDKSELRKRLEKLGITVHDKPAGNIESMPHRLAVREFEEHIRAERGKDYVFPSLEVMEAELTEFLNNKGLLPPGVKISLSATSPFEKKEDGNV